MTKNAIEISVIRLTREFFSGHAKATSLLNIGLCIDSVISPARVSDPIFILEIMSVTKPLFSFGLLHSSPELTNGRDLRRMATDNYNSRHGPETHDAVEQQRK